MINAGGGGWDSEISWTLVDENGVTVASNAAVTGLSICLEPGCYTINLNDSYGDGWNGATWTLSNLAGTVLIDVTMAAGSFVSYEEAVGGAVCTLPCPDGYTFSAGGGYFDSEISWALYDEGGALVASGGATSSAYLCLTAGCYELQLYDSFGDGWDGAVWQLLDAAGNSLGSGTLFGGASGVAYIPVGGGTCPDVGSDAITVQAGVYSAEELITDIFLGDCLEATNINYTGSNNAIGTFANGGAIGVEEGIIISTGDITTAPGPNVGGGVSGYMFTAGDALLSTLAGSTTYDAAVFEFEFTASTDQVEFTYVFASEEYPEFVCGIYNDAFGFFVSGPGYAANTNIAAVPGSTDLVSINNVNDIGTCPPTYPAYYNTNVSGTAIEFDGYTTPMTAVINTTPCETYQIKIAVADAGDEAWDSAVFLQAESFNAGIDLDVTALSDVGAGSSSTNCTDLGSFNFTLNGDPLAEDVDIAFTIGGTATGGVDYIDPGTSITLPAGSSTFDLDITGFLDQLSETPETITLELDDYCTCTPPAPVTLYICALLMLSIEWEAFEVTCAGNEVVLDWTVSGDGLTTEYAVQRSVDGQLWETLGWVEHTDVVTSTSFAFTDRSPLGDAYYRILRYDVNGSWEASAVRGVSCGQFGDPLVGPNPSNGLIHIHQWTGPVPAVHDSRGREIPVQVITPNAIQLQTAETGIYTLTFTRPDGSFHHERVMLR